MEKISRFFKDKTGRVVIYQTPNSPLLGFLLFKGLSLFWPNQTPKTHLFFELISFGFIFTWAWLEITSGVNYFRRTLGLVVLLVVIYRRFTL